jgi:7-cyano-7-deazaguanine synthase in queuosine biosynthesis
MLYPHNTTVKDALLKKIAKTHPPQRKLKTLLMLSGGLDSVVLLATFLAHTDHEIHAHHIEIRNTENRADIENQTLERVFPYLKEHYRPFTYSTSKYELMLGLGGGLDMTLATFMAARVNGATGASQDFIITGHVNASVAEYNEASAVFTACYTNHRNKPLWLVPLARLRKFDIYNAIPPALADLTWSCRRPLFDGTNHTPCQKCHACETRRDLSDEVAKYKELVGAV